MLVCDSCRPQRFANFALSLAKGALETSLIFPAHPVSERAVAVGRNSKVIFFLGECALDTERRELRRNGVVWLLEPQVFDVLEYVIRNRDRVVSRDELLEAVWHGRIVSDAALDTRLSAARKAIGDSGVAQHFIRTLRTRGVHFVAPVREEASVRPAMPGGLLANRVAPLDYPTVAVLPLIAVGGSPQLDMVADGITEDLITALS